MGDLENYDIIKMFLEVIVTEVCGMENDKFQELVLNHLVRLTQDNTGIKQNIAGIEKNVTGIGQDIHTINQRLEKVETAVIRIENDHGEKLKALFDAREAQIDVNERIFDALNRIEGKVDRLVLKVSAHEAVLKKVP
jgi:hypothetical protein